MSYLDLPRITFVGSFYTDPSTMDNDPSHYDPSCTNPSPWQDPGGSHFFAFNDLLKLVSNNPRSWKAPVITGVLDANGNLASTDVLFGCAVTSIDNSPVPAKLVDLDPYQQGVSTIYGFQLAINIDGVPLVGAMDPATLNSVHFDRVLPTRGWQGWDSYGWGSFGGDSNAAGFFQSVLRIPQKSWPNTASTVLQQLRQATSTDANGNVLLSLRLTLDGYQNVPWHSADFRIGRVVGTIGPYAPNEPTKCVAGRWLNGRTAGGGDAWNQPSFYGAPFKIAQRANGNTTLVVDLSNGLSMQFPGGSPVDLGNMTAQIGDGSTGAVGPFQANDSLYQGLGGIIELSLSPAQAAAAANNPVCLLTSRTDIAGFTVNGKPTQQLWQESPDGLLIAANDRVLRLTSDAGGQQNSAICNVYVTQWGQPAQIPLYAYISPCFPGNGAATVPWSAKYKGDTVQASGALQAEVETSYAGCYPVQLSAVQDPGSRTPQLDGQLYFIVFYTEPGNPPSPNLDPPPPQEQMISCVVWESYPVNQNPQWAEVQQIMTVYDKLFPSMHSKVNLTDEVTFNVYAMNPPWSKYYSGGPKTPPPPPYVLPNGKQIAAGAIPWFLTRSQNDPSYMPIMRDLSPNKLNTVLYYCFNTQQAHPPASPSPAPKKR